MTREIVADCLTLRKAIKSQPAQDTAKWVGESTDKYVKEFEVVEAFEGDEHLKAEFSKMLDVIEAGDERPAAKKAKIEALKEEYKTMISQVYGLFHLGRKTIETESLLHYFIVEAGEVMLPKDIDERIKADTATYAETEKGVKAYKLHRQIAEKLNTLADLMKNVPRYEFAAELDKLFYQSEEGTIQATPIDYDLFT